MSKPPINMSDKISVSVIVCSAVAFFVHPLAGVGLGATLTAMYFRKRRDIRRAAEDRTRLLADRASPINQATMRGNGDDGGLSIEEANAYRRRWHERRK